MNLYLLVAIAAAALAVAAGIWDGYRLRRKARYSPLVLAISAGGPVISLLLFLLVGGLELKLSMTFGLLATGAALGALVAGLARISVVVPCEDEDLDKALEPCSEDAETEDGQADGQPKVPQLRLVGASWMPVPAALAVAALQVASALEALTWEVLALAALEAAAAFGVASAAVLVRRRSRFERGTDGPDEAVEASSGAPGEAAAAQG
jgi:lysylphosphatidylglycerol synthetase-like protein (DUF2156 family)